MNTICVVIGVVFFICVLTGWIRGLFKVLISVGGLIASILIATYIAPRVSGYLEEHTQIDDRLASYISEELEFNQRESDPSKGAQVAIINELPVSENMKTDILDNNNSEMYDILQVIGIYDYISKSIAIVILNTAVFLFLVLANGIFFYFLGKISGIFSNIPIVRWVDKIGGGFLGAVQGLILIWIFFLILSVISSSSWSRGIITEIQQSTFLKLLYDNNVLLDIVGDLTKILFF